MFSHCTVFFNTFKTSLTLSRGHTCILTDPCVLLLLHVGTLFRPRSRVEEGEAGLGVSAPFIFK